MELHDLHSHRDAILQLAERYHAGNVRVFGSVARAEARDGSDIDLLVHFLPGASLMDESGLQLALEDMLKKPVDVLADDAIRPEFKARILSESIPL